MFAITGVTREYAWGSRTAIPEFLGDEPGPGPLAELWFGAHASGPSHVPALDVHLADLIADNPRQMLGEECARAFEGELPFLLKLLAPAAPLSMQVHPSREQARDGYARARAGGPEAPRDYVDRNHKPEMLYPLTEFEALCGFRSADEVHAVLDGLDHPVLDRVRGFLAEPDGVKAAFTHVLETIEPREVSDIAEQVRRRAGATGDSSHAAEIVVRLEESYPGDRGVVASLLLVPRILQPGEVMLVPAGVVHAYFRGLAVELMANSDNVLRAGLTPKNVDVPELLMVVDEEANAVFLPERPGGPGLTRFRPPVEDFELTVVNAADAPVGLDVPGPRILLALADDVAVTVADPHPRGSGALTLARGQAAFVADCEGAVRVEGGTVLHAALPARAGA